MNVEKHPLVRDVFIIDTLPLGALPVYETDSQVSAVVLDYDKEAGYVKPIVRGSAYHSGYEMYRVWVPMPFTHQIDPDTLEEKVIDLLLTSAHINSNVFHAYSEIEDALGADSLTVCCMIAPMADTSEYRIPSSINAVMLLGNGEYKLHRSRYLKGRCICVPSPEYLGVVAKEPWPIMPNLKTGKVVEEAKYGIAVIVSRNVYVLE